MTLSSQGKSLHEMLASTNGVAGVAPVATFIEPGMGKDSDCKALVHHMNEKIGKTDATDEIPKNR